MNILIKAYNCTVYDALVVCERFYYSKLFNLILLQLHFNNFMAMIDLILGIESKKQTVNEAIQTNFLIYLLNVISK